MNSKKIVGASNAFKDLLPCFTRTLQPLVKSMKRSVKDKSFENVILAHSVTVNLISLTITAKVIMLSTENKKIERSFNPTREQQHKRIKEQSKMSI